MNGKQGGGDSYSLFRFDEKSFDGFALFSSETSSGLKLDRSIKTAPFHSYFYLIVLFFDVSPILGNNNSFRSKIKMLLQ